MPILISRILIIFLLFSFTTEITLTAFANENAVYSMLESDDSKEEKNEKEENKDKISTEVYFDLVSINSDIKFYHNLLIKTSAYKSLPEIPPDQF